MNEKGRPARRPSCNPFIRGVLLATPIVLTPFDRVNHLGGPA